MRSEPVVQDLRLGKTKPSSAEKPLIGKENLAPKVVFDESLAARKESFGEEIIPQIKVKKKQLDAFSFISQEKTYSILIKTRENNLKKKKNNSKLYLGLVGENGQKTKYARVPTALQGMLKFKQMVSKLFDSYFFQILKLIA